jgi:hypothetical protein
MSMCLLAYIRESILEQVMLPSLPSKTRTAGSLPPLNRGMGWTLVLFEVLKTRDAVG